MLLLCLSLLSTVHPFGNGDVLFTAPVSGDILWGGLTFNVTWTESWEVPLITDLAYYDLVLYAGNNTNPRRAAFFPQGNFGYQSYELAGPTWQNAQLGASVGPDSVHGYFFGIVSHLTSNETITVENFSSHFTMRNMTGNNFNIPEVDDVYGPGRVFSCGATTTGTCPSSIALAGVSLATSENSMFFTSTSTGTVIGPTSFPLPTAQTTESYGPAPLPTYTLPDTTVILTPTAAPPAQTTSHDENEAKTKTTVSAVPATIIAIVLFTGGGMRLLILHKKKHRKRLRISWWNNIPLPKFGAAELSAGRGLFETAELPTQEVIVHHELPTDRETGLGSAIQELPCGGEMRDG